MHDLPVPVHRLRHLHRQLTRGDEDQGGGALPRRGVGREPVQEGEGKGSGLAGPRGGLREHVTAGQQGGDGSALDGGRFFVAERRERGEDPLVEAEVGEAAKCVYISRVARVGGSRWSRMGAWGHDGR